MHLLSIRSARRVCGCVPLLLLAFATSASRAAAQTVSGRLVDASGVGVANVDLDFKSVSGGSDPTVSQDFTDANGFFTTSVTPAGVYRIEFLPPAPPASTSMYLRIDNVAINTTTNLGVITLPQGVALTGRCVTTGGVPAPGVNLDIELNGVDLDLVHDTTDALGNFAVAVPQGALKVEFDTTSVLTAVLAPRQTSATVSGPTNLGDIVHPPGFVLSAFVKRQSNNAPVVGADIDVVDALTGELLYTPSDSTDAIGFVDTLVPAGVFDVRFDAPSGSGLVSLELLAQSVVGPTFLGTRLLPNGVTLSGVVTNAQGVPQAGVDVDVELAATGVEVYVGPDNTNSAGAYSVVVLPGVYNLDYSPSYSVPLAGVQLTNVAVNTNKVQNVVLPACPFSPTIGTGIAGTGGITPQISSSGGTPRLGNSAYTLRVTQGRGAAVGIVIYSLNPATNPLPSPMQGQAPMQRKIVLLNGVAGVAGAGSATFAMPIANNPLLAGHLLRAWFRVRDVAAPSGLSSTNELRATVCF